MQPKDLDEEMKLVEQKLARRRKKAVLKEGLFLKDDEESASLSFTPTIERKSAIDYLVESSPLIQERYKYHESYYYFPLSSSTPLSGFMRSWPQGNLMTKYSR